LEKWIPLKARKPLAKPAQGPVNYSDQPGLDNDAAILGRLQEKFRTVINADTGLMRSSGSVKKYLEILEVFILDAVGLLHDLMVPPKNEAEMLKNAAIKVHALKSASANIGALNFSQEAAYFEKAANDGQIKVFQEKQYAAFLDSLGDLISLIKTSLRQVKAAASAESISQKELFKPTPLGPSQVPEATLILLAQALEEFNLKKSENLIESISSGADEKSLEILTEMSGLLLVSDFQEARSLVDQLKRQ
jgi:HPt (histidine-containing phosphotransfer) domain-containing protein